MAYDPRWYLTVTAVRGKLRKLGSWNTWRCWQTSFTQWEEPWRCTSLLHQVGSVLSCPSHTELPEECCLYLHGERSLGDAPHFSIRWVVFCPVRHTQNSLRNVAYMYAPSIHRGYRSVYKLLSLPMSLFSTMHVRRSYSTGRNFCTGLDGLWEFQEVEAPRFPDNRHPSPL